MRHRQERFDARGGVEIFWQAWLPDETPKLALHVVHGMGDHGGRYQNYVDAFVPRGYAIYAADMRGCGRSSGRRGHVDRFDDFVNDVRQMHTLVQNEQPGRAIFMAGHSFGSLVSLAYGLQYPDGLAGMIVSGTAIQDGLPYPDWMRSLTGRLGRILPTLALPSGVKAEDVSREAAVVQAYKDDPLIHSVGTLRWAAEAIRTRKWLLDHAHEWKLPLLMLHGGADQICLKEGARRWQERIADGRVTYHEYEAMYHEVHNEIGKEKVFQDIEAWLKKTDPV